MKNWKAFSLIELLTVMVVVVVLALLVVPRMIRVLETHHTLEAEETLVAIRSEQEARCVVGHGYETDKNRLSLLREHSSNPNFTYTLQETGATASRVGKDYEIKMLSYKTGSLCCEGTECVNLNKGYPICTETAAQAALQDECVGESSCNANERPNASQPCTEGEGIEMREVYCYGGVWQTGEWNNWMCASNPGESGEGGPGSSSGWQSCDSYPCDKTCARPVVTGFTCDGTYNEDKSYTEKICQTNTANDEVCVVITYNSDGQKTYQYSCQEKNDTCEKEKEFFFEDGNKVAERLCTGTSNGVCTTYTVTNFEYENGKMTSQRTCATADAETAKCLTYNYQNAADYKYDGDNMLYSRRCNSVNSSTGECTSYSGGTEYKYQDGKLVAKRSCSGYNSDKECSSFTSGSSYAYSYNDDKVLEMRCSGVNSATWACNSLASGGHKEYKYENGQKVSEVYCTSVYNGSCTSYSESYSVPGEGYKYAYEYSYDNGTQIANRCGSINTSTGDCSTYRAYEKYDSAGHLLGKYECSSNYATDAQCGSLSTAFEYGYDGAGNNTTYRVCNGFGANGECTSYSSGKDYTYDELGNRTSARMCSSWTGTTCNSWQAIVLTGEDASAWW